MKHHLILYAVLLLAAPALATDYTWTNPAGGSFVGNFAPGGTATPAADTVLVFPDLFAPQAGYTALNNLGSFTLNAIRFETNGSPNPAATTVQAGAAAGFTLRFAANGTTQPSIQVNGNGMARIENGTATVGVTLTDGTNLVVGGTGLGSFELAAVVRDAAGGSAGMTINHTGPFILGAGPTIRISGVNAYSAGTSIVRGNVVVAANGAFGSGPVIINGTEHSLSFSGSASAVANVMVLNQTLRLTGGFSSFTAGVSGPGGLTLDSAFPFSGGTHTFSGPGTATGPVRVGADRTRGFTLAFSGQGTAQYSSYEIGPGSELQFDNSSVSKTRVTAAAPPLALRGGTVTLIGGPGEVFGTLTAAGYSVVSAGGALRFAGLTRDPTATLDFVGTNITITAAPGGAIGGILPYAVGATSTTTTSRSLVRYDAPSGRIGSLNPATDYSSVQPYAAGQANHGANVYRAGTTAVPSTGSVAGLVGTVALNAMVLENTSLAGPGTLTLGSGALVQTPGLSGVSIVNLGGLNFGANPGYVHGISDLTVNAAVAGTGGVVKSGNGTLTLNGASPFTGGLTINAGVVAVSTDAALGAAGGGVTLNGGSSMLAFVQNRQFDPTPSPTLTTTRPIAVGLIGGALANGVTNGTFTVAGPITGSGRLTISTPPSTFDAGVVVLSGANSFTGQLFISSATLAVAADSALGAPSASLYSVGTLRIDGSFATSRTVDSPGTILLPAGRLLQLDGPVAGQGLTVIGAGELVLTTSSLLEGGVAVGENFSGFRPGAPAGTPTGATLTLRGPNGALPLAGRTGAVVQINPGGTLHLDNSGPAGNANPNRLSGSNLQLLGGELRLTGNAASDLTEAVGGLTATGLLNTVTLVQPDSGGAGRQTALIATGYTPASSGTIRDVLFVRGTNFGAATGDRTALLLNTDPVPVNGLIEGMVVSRSATGTATDFAAATPVGSQFAVTPFTAYAGPVPAAGGSAASTYDNTATTAVTVNVAANALRLSAGGGVQLAAGTTLTLSTGMVLALPGNAGIRGGTLTTARPLRVVSVGDMSLGTAAEPTAVVAGNGFVKAGPGRLTLFGTAATTLGTVPTGRATVTVAEGTLALGNAQAVLNSTVNGVAGVLPDFYLGATATLDLSALPGPVRMRSVSGLGAVQVGSGTVQMGDLSTTFGGGVAGTAAAAVVVGTPQSEAAGNTFGGGIVTLAGDNSGYAGGFTVLRGTLSLISSLSAGSGTSPIVLGDTSGTGQAQLSLGPTLALTRDITVRAGATPSTPHTLLAGGATTNSSPRNSTQIVSGNIVLGQTLQLGQSATSIPTVFFTGTISGPGALQQSSLDAIFTGNNTFSGGFNMARSVVGLGSNSTPTTGPLGTGPVRLDSGGTLLAYGGPRTLSNPILMTGTTPEFALTITGLNDLTLTGAFDYSGVTPSTQPVQIRSQSAGVTTFAGPVMGAPPLQKTGTGTVVFANPGGNPYTGGTIVNAGTLIAANTSGSATGTSAVAVNNGAILGGTGIVAGATTVAGGGVLRAGANETAAGTLTLTGNVTMQTQSIVSVTLNGSSAGKLQLAGGFFDLTGATTLTVFATGSPPATAQSYTIVDSGAIPIAFFNGFFNASNFAVSASFPFTALTVSNPTPTTLVLNYTPVPEPTGILAVAAVAAGMAWRVGGRREKRAAQR